MTEKLIIYVFSLLMSVGVTVVVLPSIINISYKKRLMDVPDIRKRHTVPVPRLGGICFMPVMLLCTMLANVVYAKITDSPLGLISEKDVVPVMSFSVGCTMLYLVGIADDLVEVGYKQKFLAQIAAACMLPLAGIYLHTDEMFLHTLHLPLWVQYFITVFLVVYITNAINLIDGVDGLASGITIMAVALYSVLFFRLSEDLLLCASVALMGALAVFFVFNVFGGAHRMIRKLFMGDTGSLTLGYFISFVVLYMSTEFSKTHVLGFRGAMYAVMSPLVIPLLDIIRVMLARYRDGVGIFKPDRRHIHHKLIRTGLSAHWTMATLLMLTFGFMLLNIILPRFMPGGYRMAVCNIVAWVIMHFTINYFIRRKEGMNPEKKPVFDYSQEDLEVTDTEG